MNLNCFQDCSNEEIRAEASTYLIQIQPTLLHFLADEYDDTCSTVFPLLQIILARVSVKLFPPVFFQLTLEYSINATVK